MILVQNFHLQIKAGEKMTLFFDINVIIIIINVIIIFDNKNKNILILGEGPTQGLNDTTLTAEAKYPINFT